MSSFRATMLRSIANSVFRGRFIVGVRSLSNRASADNEEIPAAVRELREANMPKEMEDPFKKPKPMCVLCKYDVKLDYKNVRLLSQFVSRFSGKVYGRHISGLCERQQKLLERAVQKARSCGLMPYYFKDPVYCKDPLLFYPNRPFKSHKY